MEDLIKKNTRVLLLGVNTIREKEYLYYMDELKALVEGLGDFEVVDRVIQNQKETSKKYFTGKGKAFEVGELIKELNIELVVVNGELSAVQSRELEKIFGVDIMDRTMVILNIFKSRATTREGQLQVQIATLKYSLPRLLGSYSGLSKQVGSGGGAHLKGSGEKEIDLDKRRLREKIYSLEKELEKISFEKDLNRKKRIKENIKKVSLVGYTNVGKSTILNYFLEEEKKVLEKDMLFATLDTASRKIKLNNGEKIILSDTIGFVSNLPHHLVRAFKSTLDEIIYSDLIVEVRDLTSPTLKIESLVVEDTLNALGCSKTPKIIVYNKVDGIKESEKGKYKIEISAKSGLHLENFLDEVEIALFGSKDIHILEIPYERGDLINLLKTQGEIVFIEYLEDAVKYSVFLRPEELLKYKAYLK